MFIEKLEELIKQEIPQDDSTSREEKMILHDEIKRLKPKTVVETGTHRGLTTCYMLCALADNEFGHLHTADPFEWGAYGNFAKFMDLHPYVTYHQKPGVELADNIKETGIDFAFIDGFHEKFHVVAEIEALFPYLNEGAVVYFHDTNGRNESCDVPGGIEEKGLKVEYLKTLNGMAKYVHNNNSQYQASIPEDNAGDVNESNKPKLRVARSNRISK